MLLQPEHNKTTIPMQLKPKLKSPPIQPTLSERIMEMHLDKEDDEEADEDKDETRWAVGRYSPTLCAHLVLLLPHEDSSLLLTTTNNYMETTISHQVGPVFVTWTRTLTLAVGVPISSLYHTQVSRATWYPSPTHTNRCRTSPLDRLLLRLTTH